MGSSSVRVLRDEGGSGLALEVSRNAEALAEQMLSDAYELVISGWCQGAGARDEMGRPIEPSSAFARRWSPGGALERVWRRAGGDPDEALEAFERANLALAAAIKERPERWNDSPTRTHAEVLDALVDAHRFLRLGAPEPLTLVEGLLDTIDRDGAIPTLLFEKPA
jgi:hypothetical protein